VDPLALSHLEFAGLFAQAGRPDRAREILDLYLAEVDAEIRDENGQQSAVHMVQGTIALAEGRSEEALQEMLLARELAEDCVLCVLPELGEAYAAVGRHQEAVEALNEYLQAPVLRRVNTDNVALHGVLVDLAQSYEAMGEDEKAAEHFRWALELWSDADPGLNPRVEELRAALARAGGT